MSNLSFQQLQVIPWDLIDAQTEMLDVSHNEILDLSDIPETLHELAEVFAGNNKIKSFPNLFNIRFTLRRLGLEHNNITRVEPTFLLQLQELEVLNLLKNPLVFYPEACHLLPKLYKLGIGKTRITILKKTCYADPKIRQNGQLMLGHVNNRYICDMKMLWYKMSLESGIITERYAAKCKEPLWLKGKPVNELNNSQFFNKGKFTI